MKQKPNTLPTSNIVLGYKDILGTNAPTDRLCLIENISQDHIIAEIAGLNYRLKGRFSKEVDSSISAQQRELLYFCGNNITLPSPQGLRETLRGRKIKAINSVNADQLLNKFIDHQESYYNSLSSKFDKFKDNWNTRAESLRPKSNDNQ